MSPQPWTSGLPATALPSGRQEGHAFPSCREAALRARPYSSLQGSRAAQQARAMTRLASFHQTPSSFSPTLPRVLCRGGAFGAGAHLGLSGTLAGTCSGVKWVQVPARDALRLCSDSHRARRLLPGPQGRGLTRGPAPRGRSGAVAAAAARGGRCRWPLGVETRGAATQPAVLVPGPHQKEPPSQDGRGATGRAPPRPVPSHGWPAGLVRMQHGLFIKFPS